MVALAGAGPWPQITSVLPVRTSLMMTGTSPPGPLRWGSTTCSVKAVATAASKAFPPLSSIAMPTAVAIQWVDVTTPQVPSISGRVVNGFGLMFFIDALGADWDANKAQLAGATNPRRSLFGRSLPGDEGRTPASHIGGPELSGIE